MSCHLQRKRPLSRNTSDCRNFPSETADVLRHVQQRRGPRRRSGAHARRGRGPRRPRRAHLRQPEGPAPRQRLPILLPTGSHHPQPQSHPDNPAHPGKCSTVQFVISIRVSICCNCTRKNVPFHLTFAFQSSILRCSKWVSNGE